MVRLLRIFLFLVTMLTACNAWRPGPLSVIQTNAAASPKPIIMSAIPILVTVTPAGGSIPNVITPTPSETPLHPSTLTSDKSQIPASPLASLTYTPTVTTTALSLPAINLEIQGCNTSLDFSHKMGEVTNAYVTISNVGSQDIHDICAILSASDEDRRHPDKSQCIAELPNGFQVSFKLTVDTGFGVDTSIQVDVFTPEGILITKSQPSCRNIGLPNPNQQYGIVQPIP
ncbi:MAG: hypothetical protein AB1345_01635 [Chloroflexota bacterium]